MEFEKIEMNDWKEAIVREWNQVITVKPQSLPHVSLSIFKFFLIRCLEYA